MSEKIRAGVWVGDCFLYTTSANKLQYTVGGRTETLAHLDKYTMLCAILASDLARSMYLLGYLPRTGRMVLMDKAFNLVGYHIHLATINYQTAILRKGMY